MNAIIVTEKEIKVNGYPVSELPNLGFEFSYLYYEPDAQNLFKFVKVSEDLIRSNLLESEKAQCASYCSSFVPEIVEPIQPAPEAEDPLINFVTVDGFVGGVKPKSQLEAGEVELSREDIRSIAYSSVNQIDYIWDFQQSKFIGLGYENQRLQRYYAEVPINNQLDAIWAFIEASEIELPTKTKEILDKLKSIKQDIPKS